MTTILKPTTTVFPTCEVNNNKSEEIRKIKKKVLQKEYDEKFIQDKKKHKWGIVSLSIGAIVGILGLLVKTNDKLVCGILGIGSGIGLLFEPFLRPKKEKYDAIVEKKLNEVI